MLRVLVSITPDADAGVRGRLEDACGFKIISGYSEGGRVIKHGGGGVFKNRFGKFLIEYEGGGGREG